MCNNSHFSTVDDGMNCCVHSPCTSSCPLESKAIEARIVVLMASLAGEVAMGYELHVVRTLDWLKADLSPITFPEVERVVLADPELAFSKSDFVDVSDASGAVAQYPAIVFMGISCFWWDRDQIRCKNPSGPMVVKLAHVAKALDAYLVGDEGERYDLRKDLFGNDVISKRKIIGYSRCASCGGEGYKDDRSRICVQCYGTGQVAIYEQGPGR